MKVERDKEDRQIVIEMNVATDLYYLTAMQAHWNSSKDHPAGSMHLSLPLETAKKLHAELTIVLEGIKV